jgi:hypothetical protein
MPELELGLISAWVPGRAAPRHVHPIRCRLISVANALQSLGMQVAFILRLSMPLLLRSACIA